MTHPHQKGADVPITTTTKPLDTIVAETRDRVAELEPLVHEHNRLTAFLNAVDEPEPRATIGQPQPAGARRARITVDASSTTTGAPVRRGRPRGSGKRADQVLGLLRGAGEPMTVREIAERIGIKPNYLYRVLPELEEQGRVRKDGPAYRLVI